LGIDDLCENAVALVTWKDAFLQVELVNWNLALLLMVVDVGDKCWGFSDHVGVNRMEALKRNKRFNVTWLGLICWDGVTI